MHVTYSFLSAIVTILGFLANSVVVDVICLCSTHASTLVRACTAPLPFYEHPSVSASSFVLGSLAFILRGGNELEMRACFFAVSTALIK